MNNVSELNKSILVLGLGGVGGFAFEMLVRAGITNITIADKDIFEESNLNRQLACTSDSIGKYKVDVYKERALKINKDIIVDAKIIDINSENVDKLFDKKYDYIIDCLDDTNAKLAVIKYAENNNINIISSMGTAYHNSTEKMMISDISKTRYCPLAKKMRSLLKENNIYNLKSLFIDEEPLKEKYIISYVPAIAGCKLAEYVLLSLID